MTMVAKGTLYLMGAQLTTTISGYLIHLILARLFGPSTYGDFGIILSLILITKTLFLTGTNRAIAKFIAEDKEKAGAILRSGLYLQLIIIALNTAIYLAFADNIAALFKDSGLAGPIRLSSLIVLPLGINVIYANGYLNGKGMFREQAFLEALHSILKVVFAVLLVVVGFGLNGAISAHILAPLAVVIITQMMFHPQLSAEKFEMAKLVKFAVPITMFYTLSSLTTDASLLFVKRLLVDDALTGFYTAASTIAKITFSVFTALPFTLLPSIASAIAENNEAQLQRYISQSLRYSMIILFPLAALTSIYAQPIVEILYSHQYAQAAAPLPLLAWGFTLYSFVMIFSSIVQGANKPNHAMIISGGMLIITIVANMMLIPIYGLVGAALATFITGAAGVIVSAIYTWRKFKTLVSMKSFIKIGGATALLYGGGYFLPAQGIMALIYGAFLGMVYLGLLFALKEITRQDFTRFLPSRKEAIDVSKPET